MWNTDISADILYQAASSKASLRSTLDGYEQTISKASINHEQNGN
ncbi:MAG TPA: hypothetical protein VIK78_00110 [Ruminiclostridium sp.]